MTTPPNSSAPNLSREGTHDPTKNHAQVVFQQGKPVFDVDLNDQGAISRHADASLLRTLSGPLRVALRRAGEWQFHPLEDSADLGNFGITRGVLATTAGFADSWSIARDGVISRIVPFDYKRYADSYDGEPPAEVEPYANHILKGVATGGSTTTLTDDNKFFREEHRLTGTSKTLSFPARGSAPAYAVELEEGRARLVMLTGAAAGEEREISSHTAQTLTLASAFSSAVSAGDEYVIVPWNGYVDGLVPAYEGGPDNASAFEGDFPFLVCYSDVWNEDVSPAEDPDLVHPLLPNEDVSHRVETRWCVRTALLTVPPEGPRVADTVAMLRGSGDLNVEALVDSLDSLEAGPLAGRGYATSVNPEDPTSVSPFEGVGKVGALSSAVPQRARQGYYGEALLAFFDAAMAVEFSEIGADYHAAASLWVYAAKNRRSLADLEPTTMTLSLRMTTTGESDPSPDPDVVESVPFWGEQVKGSPSTPAWLVHRRAVVMPIDQMSTEILRSTTRSRAYGGVLQRNRWARDTARTAEDVTKSWGSISERLSHVDRAVSTLMGHSDGEDLPGGKSVVVYRVEDDFEYPLTAGGIPATSFSVEGYPTVNPSPGLYGTVSPVDPIAAASRLQASGDPIRHQESSDKSYSLRSGERIEENDEKGWSFYREVEDPETGEVLQRVRDINEGVALAAAHRDGLNFRKLAVKTVAFNAQDLFTWNHDIELTSPSVTDGLDTSDLSQQLARFFKADGFGLSSFGAFQSAFHEELSGISTNSYAVGGLVTDLASPDSPVGTTVMSGDSITTLVRPDFEPANVILSPPAPVAIPGTGDYLNDVYFRFPGNGAIDVDFARRTLGSAFDYDGLPDGSLGPWGRFNVTTLDGDHALAETSGTDPSDRVSDFRAKVPVSTWEGRCTSMRVRYHIGDSYFHGDSDENALIDTLNLFVRIEPLSLVHWATMPKHQHTVIQNSLNNFWNMNRALLRFWAEPLATGEGDIADIPSPAGMRLNADTFGPAWNSTPTNANDYPPPGSGPDRPTDTAFVGSIGTNFARRRNWTPAVYPTPLALGGSWEGPWPDGFPEGVGSEAQQKHWGQFTTLIRGVVEDGYQLASMERRYIYENVDVDPMSGINEAFLPLMNTMLVMENASLQQKLLWNSSLRVLHARPGGGYRRPEANPADYEPRVSTAPKSLTEMFLVRNRMTGQAVPMPSAPDRPDAKPFLHLESMHPAAGGGLLVKADRGSSDHFVTGGHPNYPWMWHLYNMVADSLGAQPVANRAVFAFNTTSLQSSTALDTRGSVVSTQPTISTRGQSDTHGGSGDVYAADPFDAQYERAARPGAEVAKDARTYVQDRLQENSGIEIDLLAELRHMRANASDYNLDAVGTGGLTWLDMMPTPEELTAPGCHEIIFVLHTGKHGQKFADASVPSGYNPPFAGCRIVAQVEVNRPSEKRDSTEGDNLHYGREVKTWHILGHN